jgi:site-specific recombinase XerD
MLIEDYERYITRRLSPATVKLRMFWIRKLADTTDLATATTDDLYDYLESNPEWSPASRATIISSFRIFYRWTHAQGHTTHNPALELVSIKVPRRTSRIATDDVILAAIARASLTDQAMLRLGAECGLRVAEIARLHQDNREGEWLTITGKGGVTRSVYLTEELAAVLDAIEQTTMRWGYYFPGQARRPIAPSTVWRHIRELTELNTHALRHRAGTAVYRNTGYDLRLTQEFLGHASPTTTAIYVHVEREQLRKAAQASRLAA